MTSRKVRDVPLGVFGVLMLVAIAVLGYAGWLLGGPGDAPVGALQTPTAPPPSVLPIAPCPLSDAPAAAAPGQLFEAHVVTVDDDGPSSGVAYLPGSRTLVVGNDHGDSTAAVSVTLFGDPAGTASLPVERVDAIASMDDGDGRLLVLDAERRMLHVVAPDPTGGMAPVQPPVDLRAADVGTVTGIDVDRRAGEVVLADATNNRLVRVALAELARGTSVVGHVAGACSIDTSATGGGMTAVAVRPTDGHIFLAPAAGAVVHELAPDGSVLRQFELDAAVTGELRGMTFAPSADPTDDAETLHLYAVSSDERSTRIHALSFSAPAPPPASAAQITGTIVSRVDTSRLEPPSSDPGGIAYDARQQRYVVTDSDIDELPEFADHVVFALNAEDTWEGLGQPRGAEEITDVTIDDLGRHWFFTDDSKDIIIQVDIGEDERFGTSDDDSSAISTAGFGSLDPEGVAFGQNSLFISDGVSAEIFRLSPGEDGVFTGVEPRGDDELTQFDTAALGITDPEGVTYDAERGTLLISSRNRREPILEVATDGTLLSVITVDREQLVSPGGIALAPALDGSGRMHVFIPDRGADNATSGTPNDGRLLEVRIER